MARERYGVDGNLLTVQVLQRHFGDRVAVAAGADVDSIDNLPLIIVDAAFGNRAGDSSVAMAWQWNVSVAIVGIGIELVADIADELHEFLESFQESWDMSHGIIPGVGAITATNVTAIPTKSASTAIPTGNLTQFDGSFEILTQKA